MDDNQIRSWYEQYKTGIYRYILSMTRDPELAEDVLQDTFVRLMTGNARPEPGKEQAWLYRVARNRCFDLLRKRKKQQEFAEPPPVAEERGWEFMELISPLDRRAQEIVSLKIIGGFSHREIAKITGATVAATKKRYERAIQKLRDEMEGSL